MTALPPPLEPEVLETPEGQRLAVRAAGTGRPLVCCVGGPAGHGRLFEVCLAALRARVRVVCWDYRGCGSSAPAEEYSVAADLRDLRAVLASLAPARPVLLGHSYGGMLAQLAALEDPAALAGLVLVNTVRNYGALVAGHRRGRAREGDEAYARRMGLLGRCVRGEATPEERREYRRLSSSVQDPELRELALELNDMSFPVHLAVQASLGAVDTRGRLGGLAVPTLVTGSAQDETCGDEPRRIAEEVPGAVYVDFPGSRHSPFLEERERFCEVLGEWLGGLGQVPS